MQTSCIHARLAWITSAALALAIASLPKIAAAQAPLDGGFPLPPPLPDAGPSAGADASAPAPVDPLALVPPRVVESVPPVYPAAHLSHGEHPTVVLKVTILSDGSVADLMVEHTAGPDFDNAAIAAVRRWRFEPGRRGAEPIASRIGIAVHFDLPELANVEVAAVTSAEAMAPHAHEEGDPHEAGAFADEATPTRFGATAEVDLERRVEQRGANDYRLDRPLLEAAPRADAADMLESAPGLVVARIEGDAVGHRLMLRGFDADHGQDIALSVDGVPVNQPSHIHGQGYADLGFLIPETVRGLRVTEGVYDPAQGDFAVAGSADFQLGVERRGIHLASSYGAFDTFRELMLYAPEGQPKETFAALLVNKTRGFGQNRAATSGAVVAQGVLGTGKLRLLLHGSAYASRARTANVLRRDDLDAGRVGFYDVYPYPTAEAQHGTSLRAQLGANLRYRGAKGDNGEVGVYAVFNDFRLLANYTGFIERSRTEPTWVGRGDLIEQLNQSRTWGLNGRYRTARYAPTGWAQGTLEVGVSARLDQIDQAQNLLEAPLNTTWDRRIDAAVSAADLGGYVDVDLALTRFLRLKGGVRADVLAYRIGDALQNFVPAFRRETHILGYRRSAAGVAVGPRVVLEVTPVAPLTLSAAYGEGYRSPQALLLDEGEPAPFTKVRSADFGVSLAAADLGAMRASAYYTKLDDDVVFEPTEGRAEPVGPSTRVGGVLYLELKPLSFLRGAASVTYVRATLDDPPPVTAEDPSPPFEKGQRLAYVPPLVLRLDASADHALAEVGGATLGGRVGLGFTYWSRRPLPYSEQTPNVSLLDLAVGLKWRVFELDASLLNLADARYAAMELSASSSWDPTGVPSRLPSRHVIAGAPRTWLLTLGVRL
ncbi:MAG: TonB family protein [Polyangiales bacterium]